MADGLKRAAAKATKTPTDKRKAAGMPEPARGQVWADVKPLYKGSTEIRELEIAEIKTGSPSPHFPRAVCQVLGARPMRWVEISIARMVPNSTGFRFVRIAE